MNRVAALVLAILAAAAALGAAAPVLFVFVWLGGPVLGVVALLAVSAIPVVVITFVYRALRARRSSDGPSARLVVTAQVTALGAGALQLWITWLVFTDLQDLSATLTPLATFLPPVLLSLAIIAVVAALFLRTHTGLSAGTLLATNLAQGAGAIVFLLSCLRQREGALIVSGSPPHNEWGLSFSGSIAQSMFIVALLAVPPLILALALWLKQRGAKRQAGA